MKRSASKPTIEVLLASLADPVRLRMLRVLEQDELSVGEIASVVQLPQSTVSRHLKVLSDHQWLARRSVGPATLYRMVLDDLTVESRALWTAVRGQLDGGPELREDARRLAAVLAERRLDSQSFFGRMAGEWDSIRARLFGSAFTLQAMLALLPRRWVVADLGCGTGNAAELLAPHVERVVAVDRSDVMLDAARKRLRGLKNVEFAEGAMERLPLPDRSADAAVCVMVLHHVPEPGAAVREMARVLRADRGGSVVLIVDMVQHDREEYRRTMGHMHLGFSERTIESLLHEAGFVDGRVWELPSDPDARGPGLFAATARLAG
jgi:ubiquinone/menaquinone biosynthesis C-methylase UbiE/DNA-binding transcriptional ArsR family regulator